MRPLIFQAIINDATLNSLGIVDHSSFAVDVDTPETRPFLQLRWGRNDVGVGPVTQRNLVVWVHDQPGDYTKIDTILLRLRALLPALATQESGTGGWLVDAEWLGDSEDLTDDGHRTITRNSTFRVVGSGQ